jgi:hypothetical protein
MSERHPTISDFEHTPGIGVDPLAVACDPRASTRSRVLYLLLAHHWALGHGAYTDGDRDLTTILDCSVHQLRRSIWQLFYLDYLRFDSPSSRPTRPVVGPGYRLTPVGGQ